MADFGTNQEESVDYSDFANDVCRAMTNGHFDYGILICKSGIGMSISANRWQGIRAAKVNNVEEAEVTRHHNDSNVLCLGNMYATVESAIAMTDIFLKTAFDGGRHERRLLKGSGSRLAVTDGTTVFDIIEG